MRSPTYLQTRIAASLLVIVVLAGCFAATGKEACGDGYFFCYGFASPARDSAWSEIATRDTAWSEILTLKDIESTNALSVYTVIDKLRPQWLWYASFTGPQSPASPCLAVYIDENSGGDHAALTLVHADRADYSRFEFDSQMRRQLKDFAVPEIAALRFASALDYALPDWETIGVTKFLSKCPLLQIVPQGT